MKTETQLTTSSHWKTAVTVLECNCQAETPGTRRTNQSRTGSYCVLYAISTRRINTHTCPTKLVNVFQLCSWFDAVGWVAGRASGLSKTELQGTGVVICLEWGANDLHYGPADVTATWSSLAPVKSIMLYLSGAGLLRLSWEKAVKRIYTVSRKKWNHSIFASNFASAGHFSKFFHQQA